MSTIVGYRQLVDETTGELVWYWNASRAIWFHQRSELQNFGLAIHPEMASVSTTVSYAGFTLSAMVDGQWGAKVYSSTEYDMTARGHSKS